MDGERRSIRAPRHKRDHCGPPATRWVPQPGVETKHRRRRKVQTARSEIGFDHRSAGRSRGLPNGEGLSAAFAVVRLRFDFRSRGPT
jgi:hypothetical protein